MKIEMKFKIVLFIALAAINGVCHYWQQGTGR
jgi:hypothetical protein